MGLESEKLYLKIINNLVDGVYYVNTFRRITFWNKAAENITGYKAEEIVGKCCQDNFLNHIDSDGRPLCLLGCPLFATIIDGRQRKDTVFLQHKEGHRIPVFVNIFPIEEDSKIVGAIEIFTQSPPSGYDNSALKKLLEMPLNDELAKITNRKKAESYLAYKLHEFERYQRKFCVVFFNLDNYNEFNAAYGQDTGEKMLNAVYKSISFNIRPYDFVSHWGVEEFVGIFEITKNYEATLLAEKIRILVAMSEISHEKGNLSVTGSFGVTVVRENDTIEAIIERAGSLMRQSAKNKNCVSSDA